VLAATDPANPFGVALPWPERGPQRAAGAFVVIVDGQLVLYLEKGGRSLVTFDAPDGEPDPDRIATAVDALGGLVDAGRFTRLMLDKYPESLEQALRDAGFSPSPKGLTRYPRNA
jgi:ATP-dependent Lhr-like helicase